jgi:hypothetical protein
MVKLLFNIAYFLVCLALLVYVGLSPSYPEFPSPPPGAVQSDEPADTETPLRRAYFTDLTREEVIDHYESHFIDFVTLRLNYPPEEAQTIIRDQTRSSYLEELVHPLKDSLFINGFVPQTRKDAIVIDGREFYQKITVRYVPSNFLVRIFYILFIAAAGYLVIIWSVKLLCEYLKLVRRILWKALKFR